jgi:hypothetical protein
LKTDVFIEENAGREGKKMETFYLKQPVARFRDKRRRDYYILHLYNMT